MPADRKCRDDVEVRSADDVQRSVDIINSLCPQKWDYRNLEYHVQLNIIVSFFFYQYGTDSMLSNIVPIAMSMSMSIIDLYSAEPWSISTALCVLSGSDDKGSFSAIVWSCCCWAPGHGDCPVASSRPSDQRQRRPDDRKCWADNVVVRWCRVNDVGWECLRLVNSSRPTMKFIAYTWYPDRLFY